MLSVFLNSVLVLCFVAVFFKLWKEEKSKKPAAVAAFCGSGIIAFINFYLFPFTGNFILKTALVFVIVVCVACVLAT